MQAKDLRVGLLVTRKVKLTAGDHNIGAVLSDRVRELHSWKLDKIAPCVFIAHKNGNTWEPLADVEPLL